jgi:hypothetical protein
MRRPKCGYENGEAARSCGGCGHSLAEPAPQTRPPSPEPNSFANGRHQAKKLPGEGRNKKVYLVHDTILERDVAFPLVNPEKLGDASQIGNGHRQKPIPTTRNSGHLRDPHHA